MIAALMVLAAVVDLAFCGYRGAAGRNARIEKKRYYARALGGGALTGLAVAAGMAVATAAVPAPWAELSAVGARMLVVIGAYATLVLGAIGVYVVAEHEVRTLATVAILGPFTLVRPAVIACAAAFGLWPGRSAGTTGLTLASCAAVLAAGVWLDRAYAGRRLDD